MMPFFDELFAISSSRTYSNAKCLKKPETTEARPTK